MKKKYCSVCDSLKLLTDFHKAKHRPDGHRGDCKECRSINKERDYNASKIRCNSCKQIYPRTEEFFYLSRKSPWGFRKSRCKKCHAEYRRDYHLRDRYGLSTDLFDQEFRRRKGKCDICDKKFESLVVDHDHSTERVRGLLCDKCNQGLGFLEDSRQLLQKAIDYLNHPPMTHH